jgi:hypothetical protein
MPSKLATWMELISSSRIPAIKFLTKKMIQMIGCKLRYALTGKGKIVRT